MLYELVIGIKIDGGRKMKVPSAGDYIYVPTVGDFLVGGRTKVTEVTCSDPAKNIPVHYVIVEIGMCFRWEDGGVAEMQDELKSKFGKKRAHRTGVKLSCPLKH